MSRQRRMTAHDIIDQLDLEPMMVKLIVEKGWTEEKAKNTEKLYKIFLKIKADGVGDVSPLNDDIDEFWHYHILDTQKYTEDCQQIFGEYLHHFPYLGLRDQNDVEELTSLKEKTKKYYDKYLSP